MRDCLYLAWRYLAYHWAKTTILVTSITLIILLPAGLRVLVKQSKEKLTARADMTPPVIGKKGSPLELVLNSVYFTGQIPELMQYSEAASVDRTGFASAIPLYVRFHSQGDPIVGTSLDYFELRGLEIKSGRQMGRLCGRSQSRPQAPNQAGRQRDFFSRQSLRYSGGISPEDACHGGAGVF
jgi:putative ABC transport system permease protein